MEDKNVQQPFTVSQIKNEKPNVAKTDCVLTGYIANSMNGGHNKTIHFKKIMAGERIKQYNVRLNIQMLTPKTPPYQKLKCTLRAYFVPNSRVWKNAEKYTAQKGGATEVKVKEIPNFGGINMPYVQIVNPQDTSTAYATLINNTTLWRDSFISSYIPRYGPFTPATMEAFNRGEFQIQIPAVSALPLRGRIAIYNDMERNKEYDPEWQEFDGDTVTNAELDSYIPYPEAIIDQNYFMRAKRENSYYTDYRTDVQGFEEARPTEDISTSLVDWASWMSKIAESRSEALNAQLNDWQIIAKIRGSKMLTEGKVQLIGKRTFDINYSAITQSTYNTAEGISEDFQVMGKQGAYSYTEVNLPVFAGIEFNEEGYVHVIATVSADSVFETGFDRNELNITPLDEYRPDLLGDKFDVLKKIELGSMNYSNTLQNEVIGFKRRYSEYFKLANVIAGDLVSNNYYNFDTGGSIDEQVITQKTYQFFENDANVFKLGTNVIQKNIWQDYTDLLINKNQAIMNDIFTENNNVFIKGQNQIFFVGMVKALVDLPIDPSIKENYTVWGEP